MQGCHSRVARRLVGVGSQMASIRSASIGPFGSFTTSGEGLKLPVSEFHPILVNTPAALSRGSRAQRIRKGRTAARPTSALAGPGSHAVTAAQETPRKLNGGQGRARPGLPRMHSLCIRPAERVRVSERRDYDASSNSKRSWPSSPRESGTRASGTTVNTRRGMWSRIRAARGWREMTRLPSSALIPRGS